MNDTMHDLACQRIQVDEIWSFVGKKQRRLTAHDDPTTTGDMWTFVAIDADSKLIPCYRIGKRTGREAQAFMADLESRLSNRVQLSSDALAAYVEAVELAFGSNVDYGQMVKSYEADPIGLGRYSPPRVVSVERTPITGAPAPAHISTSYVERQNLTMRMSAPVHAADQRFLEEGGEPEGGRGATLRPLQFRPHPQDSTGHASDGSPDKQPSLERPGASGGGWGKLGHYPDPPRLEAHSRIGVQVQGLRRRSTEAGLLRPVAAIDPERDDRGLDGLLTPRVHAASERVFALVLDLGDVRADHQGPVVRGRLQVAEGHAAGREAVVGLGVERTPFAAHGARHGGGHTVTIDEGCEDPPAGDPGPALMMGHGCETAYPLVAFPEASDAEAVGVLRTAPEAYVPPHGVLEAFAHGGYRGTPQGVPLPCGIACWKPSPTAASRRRGRPYAPTWLLQILKHRGQEAGGLAAGGGAVVEGQ